MDLVVESKSVSDLSPYERNARTHSPKQVAQIAESIKEFGFINPVLIHQDRIVAGHGRVEAALLLDMEEVPTISLDHLSDEQRRAYILADNKLALNAGWNDHFLTVELGELSALPEFDVTITGFSLDEIGALLDFGEGFPTLETGDRDPFQQKSFNLHDQQAALVQKAVEKAKFLGLAISDLNTNSNGNAITAICEAWLALDD